ncbi:MAG: LysR family transcriptional regulator [Candidatus Eisenbacteria bacterium]|uniref:LysR family transcriptional regulator n=1 Tax=Eiseniibacteriota bacterium TaxID=2212470 RepID=A0A948RW68_UNCEI|nr:LysR family transcriptional regulator [Candidatus Eisenbacteria bacterium]MBU1948633.1 LysR family transcriptional regulator [Candidatus Eisenbacteria bacterium]MBU2689389.1 LysR family transcriptional regulator [Candidatus Eisenbacteria bacterium]
MQIESLKIFCDVIETQSFSRAASLNGISQSAVSQQIRGLEEKYRKRLIERGKRNLAPTEAGRIFYEGAKEIQDRFRVMENRLQILSQIITGSLKVATIYSVGLHELPPYITEFIKRYPSASIHVEYTRVNKIYDDLIGNVVDLGIVAYPVGRPGIEVLPFKSDELVLICHPDHPMANEVAIDIKLLSGLNFVGFEKDIPTRRSIDRLLRAAHVNVRMVMELDNIETIKRAVEIDAGVSIVPSATVQNEQKAKTLKVVRLEGDDFERPLGVLVKRGRERSQVIEKFISLLQSGPINR